MMSVLITILSELYNLCILFMCVLPVSQKGIHTYTYDYSTLYTIHIYCLFQVTVATILSELYYPIRHHNYDYYTMQVFCVQSL